MPPRLKETGYLISPNPATNQITIQHLQTPVTLRAVQISNELGQVILQRAYKLNTNTAITIDLTSLASGVYQVKLIYQDKVITERIVKKK